MYGASLGKEDQCESCWIMELDVNNVDKNFACGLIDVIEGYKI